MITFLLYVSLKRDKEVEEELMSIININLHFLATQSDLAAYAWKLSLDLRSKQKQTKGVSKPTILDSTILISTLTKTFL